MSLSFDEFRAVSKRNKKEKDEDKADHIVQNANVIAEKVDSHERGVSEDQNKAPFTLGDFLEMQEIQGLTLLFLLLDTFTAFADLSLTNIASDYSKAHFHSVLLQIVHSLSSFFVFFFGFEIISLLIAFRLRIFGHLGYVVDMTVIGLQIWSITASVFAVESHILNIFRLWRLVRLFQSMVSVEIEAHSEARQALKHISLKKKQLEEEAETTAANLKKEQQARSSVEAMLQDYKDEIDTLNEALKIAAQDIAEVAQAEDDFFLSDEEGGEEDDLLSTDMSVSASGLSEAGGAHRRVGGGSNASLSSNDMNSEHSTGARRRKEELYREALADSSKPSVPITHRSTFVINENGTFQHS